MPPRKNGCEPPMGLNPIGALILQLVSVTTFIILVAVAVDHNSQLIVWCIYGPILFAATFCWLYCQLVDPSKEGGIGLPCIREAQKVPRWCNQCKKMVPGMDHHCEWLNTCIGKRNYLQFFILSITGWVAATVQFSVGLYMPIDNDSRLRGVDVLAEGFYVLVAVNLGLSLYLIYHYFTLFRFHTFLLRNRQGTYLYMIEERKRTLEQRKKQREEQNQQEQAKQTELAESGASTAHVDTNIDGAVTHADTPNLPVAQAT